MILDKNGNEIKQPEEKPKPHKFGDFKVPENAHIKGFDTVKADTEYQWVGYCGCGNKDQARIRDTKWSDE